MLESLASCTVVQWELQCWAKAVSVEGELWNAPKVITLNTFVELQAFLEGGDIPKPRALLSPENATSTWVGDHRLSSSSGMCWEGGWEQSPRK